MGEAPDTGFRVSGRDILDRLDRLIRHVERIEVHLKTLPDHERRIRRLERRRWGMPAALITALGSLVAAVATMFHVKL